MSRAAWIFGGAIVGIALVASTIASSSPDGLERVAADLGFSGHEATNYHAPLPDYEVPAAPPAVSGALAGLLGTATVGGLAWAAGRLVTRRAR